MTSDNLFIPRLSAKLLPAGKNKDRFSHDPETEQKANYHLIDSTNNKVWGYVTIDNIERGPGLGGIRMAPKVNNNEVKRLARAMTLKNSAACLPYGGGKAGLIIDDPSLIINKEFKKSLMEDFAEVLFELGNYIPAPDMGTDENDIQIIHENHSEKSGTQVHDRGGSGRPIEFGGIPIDEWELTAHGLFATLQTLENILDDFKLNNSKIVIQGFGNVGCPTAVKLAQKGAVITGASDINCALWEPKGLDLDELCKVRKLSGGLSNYSKKVEKEFGPKNLDWLLEAPCDVLVPAARPDAITAKNIDRIDCRMVLQGANTPSSKPVEYYLKHRKNILSLSDFIVNSGGVIGCAVERKMTQDKTYAKITKEKNTRTYTENLISNTISKNIKEVFSRMNDSKDYIFRDAAMDLAMERLKTKEVWL
ncbi:MAG: Glu/Leu/Phe/Val dehydrogenase [Nitrospina sp.]|jgi:glutamate dehydrogenase (NAD(P)+)|nr:Glu/Leu/Phe/Val dehydrogenase [Nitrospina sp.]